MFILSTTFPFVDFTNHPSHWASPSPIFIKHKKTNCGSNSYHKLNLPTQDHWFLILHILAIDKQQYSQPLLKIKRGHCDEKSKDETLMNNV
jgi:hypothetical protein